MVKCFTFKNAYSRSQFLETIDRRIDQEQLLELHILLLTLEIVYTRSRWKLF